MMMLMMCVWVLVWERLVSWGRSGSGMRGRSIRGGVLLPAVGDRARKAWSYSHAAHSRRKPSNGLMMIWCDDHTHSHTVHFPTPHIHTMSTCKAKTDHTWQWRGTFLRPLASRACLSRRRRGVSVLALDAPLPLSRPPPPPPPPPLLVMPRARST